MQERMWRTGLGLRFGLRVELGGCWRPRESRDALFPHLQSLRQLKELYQDGCFLFCAGRTSLWLVDIVEENYGNIQRSFSSMLQGPHTAWGLGF